MTLIILLLRVNLHCDCLHLSGPSWNKAIDNRVCHSQSRKIGLGMRLLANKAGR